MAISGFTGIQADRVISKINEWANANGSSINAVRPSGYESTTNMGLYIKNGDTTIFKTYDDYGASGTGAIYNNGGSKYNLSSAVASSDATYDIYFSSHGFMIKQTSGGATDLYFISLNDDGTVVYGINRGATGTSPVCMRYTDTGYQSITYTANSANSTSLCNFVAKGAIGEDSSAQYAYFMPLYQYNVAGILTLNDEQYVTNGYWCIKD